jgi:hypothetical protein
MRKNFEKGQRLKWTYREIPTNLTLQLIWMTSSSGLRGRRRTYLTILKRAWSADSKMVSSPVTSEAGARCLSKINVRVRLWESRSTSTLGVSDNETSLQPTGPRSEHWHWGGARIAENRGTVLHPLCCFPQLTRIYQDSQNSRSSNVELLCCWGRQS